ncbi:MAG: murein biosynthesis integral membrane protein MurJ [Fimbriimonadales bacterium]
MDTEPNRRSAGYSWARASFLMMSAIFASRLLGMLRDTVIAYRFGQNEFTDAYRAAFQLPDLLFFMLAGGALSSALMPVFTHHLEQGKREEAWHIFSSVATFMVSLTVGLVVLLEVATPIAIALMFPGFDPMRTDLTVLLTRIVLPTQIFFLMGGLMMSTLYARKHFLVPALGPNIYNIGIIFGGLVLAIPLGVAGLAWGAVLGSLIGSVLLPLWVMARLGSVYRPVIDLQHPGVREVFRLMLPVMFGLSLPGIYMLILRVFGSWLPVGTISALDNANRQMQAPLGIVGQGVALAIFPALNSLAANARWSELRLTLYQGLKLVWFLTVPATMLLVVLAEEISRALLQYGKFTADDTLMVAGALRAFSLGLFAWSGQALIARAFFAIRNSLTPVLVGTATTLVFIPLCLLLVWRFQMGHVGLALATSVAATIQMVWMLWLLKRRLPQGGDLGLWHTVAGSAISAAVVGLLLWLVHRQVVSFVEAYRLQPNLSAVVVILLMSAGGMALYLALCRLLKVREVDYVRRVLTRSGYTTD